MRDESPRNTDPKREELNLSTFAGAGLEFAIGIVIFVLLGQWIDRKLETRPIFLLTGVFIGGGAAFYNLYRKISRAQKADDERRRLERSGDSR